MKQSLLKEIIELKKQKKEFAILTDISNATSEIYTQDKPLSENFNKNLLDIKRYYDEKKKWSNRKYKYFYRNIYFTY